MATQEVRLKDLATRIGTQCKLLASNQGDPTALNTTAKSNLVAAINELQALVSANANATQINDTTPSATSTYSSNKINSSIAAAVAGLVNGAPAALDTLAEIADALASNQSGSAAMMTAIGNRVRFDDVQTLTAAQKAQALSNIGAAALLHSHTVSDITGLQTALDGKSDTGHLHSIANVTGLQAALDGKQVSDATLTGLAAVVTAADTLIYATASDTFSTTAITAFGRSLLAAVNAAAARTVLGLGSAALAASTDFAAASHVHTIAQITSLQTTLDAKQPINGLLTAISGVVSSANKLVYLTGSNTVSMADLTAFARTLLDDADAATVRATLGLGSAALAATTAFAAAAHTHAQSDITGLVAALAAKQETAAIGNPDADLVAVFAAALV